MLTTDPIYKKPLLPVITIKNTANNATLYTYSSFTGLATVITTVFPIYCSVNLSQNTHGEFTIQFDDPSETMESTITVNSRVQISCGKQSGTTTRLISGLVKKKGYSRGANGKILYTISGTSTGIRLNERVTYAVSEAAKLAANGQIDTTDATRKADALLATNLSPLTADGVLSITNLAANSDVETFIPSLSIEFGELQDVVNYIENQSGGEVVIDTNDLVNLRYEIKNTFFGKGFTIKNSFANAANDDADDTMYLRGKSWSYEDDFYKSSSYANRTYAILPAENRPSTVEDAGFTSLTSAGEVRNTNEIAIKFRPSHTRYIPGDMYLVASFWSNAVANILPHPIVCRICKDAAGVPQNVGGIVGQIQFNSTSFPDPLPTATAQDNYILFNNAVFANTFNAGNEFYLDMTKDYWFIITPTNSVNHRLALGKDQTVTGGTRMNHSANFSTPTAGGSGWTSVADRPCLRVGRYRSHSFTVHDPKAMQAVSSGLTGGLATDTVLTDAPAQVKHFDSMYRYLSQQIYNLARPRTMYNFPAVLAPNIPPFPGDPIVLSDTILGLSTAGNQVVLTTCGDMSYQWGNMGSGNYEAPTILNINAIGVHQRYR